MATFVKKIYTKLPVLIFDLMAIPTAWGLAYWLRFNMSWVPWPFERPYTLVSWAMLFLVQTACYFHFKVYRGLWRFSSLHDVERILKAVVSAVLLVVPLLYWASLLPYLPRSILPLYSLLLGALLCGGRLLLRFYWDYRARYTEMGQTQRVLIIGAGQAGESLIRDLKRSNLYLPVGLVDDHLSKRGLDVHGVRVLGMVEALPVLVAAHHIDLIFIAIPSARSAVMRRIVHQCERCKIPFRTLPSISALSAGRVEMNALRAVQIEDLLGRDQVELHWDKIARSLSRKRIVVTGGGGSIGSELCRQIMQLSPERLLIIDHSEFNLYQIEKELQETFPHIPVDVALVSVVDGVALDYVFQKFHPAIVFHAAAYKHVPLLQGQVRVAVQNNIVGTQMVAEASVAVGVEKFILVSSDKAVNPSNIMGATKRVAEIYCQNLNARVSTAFITVRFGNVLGSVGSVVPLFQQQLQRGGPLTVTHPDMTRYFMTISEACQLILQAMVSGAGGEIFVLDMGEPVNINYLAEQMIRLVGKEPVKDIRIEYTGLRPGEKLYEELFHASEVSMKTEHEKLFKATFRHMDWSELALMMRRINQLCVMHQNEELLLLLKRLVPEFSDEMSVITQT
jgi:FlaA1/EpsC-like NDP-sugar epimerase